jgi:hypothetical protein
MTAVILTTALALAIIGYRAGSIQMTLLAASGYLAGAAFWFSRDLYRVIEED